MQAPSVGPASVGRPHRCLLGQCDGCIIFGAVKNELVHRTTFPTRAHAHRAIVRYIEIFCNRKRLHSGPSTRLPQESTPSTRSCWQRHRQTLNTAVREAQGPQPKRHQQVWSL
ncbi:IS3 family transposase [Streptomyces kaempferi]